MAAEFAVVAGMLLVLLVALADLGTAVHRQLVLTQAVREAARRAAVVGGDHPEVVEAMRAVLGPAGIAVEEVALEVRPRRAVYGTTIRVEARYGYRLASPVLRSLAGSPVLVLRAAAVTRSELLDER